MTDSGSRDPREFPEVQERGGLDTIERRLQRALIRAGDGAPANSVQERLELCGIVKPVGGDLRQLRALDDLRAWLDLPDDLEPPRRSRRPRPR
jgi:hypothetical protein